MRPATACHACRVHRRKCRPTGPGAPCSRCISVGCSCSLIKSWIRPRSISKPEIPIDSLDRSTTSPIQNHKSWPPEEVREELVNLYFTYIHDKHHSLFHQPSFLELFHTGDVPDVLVYAMMAIAARFSKNTFFDNTHPWERGRSYAQKCKELLDLQSISLTTIQACVLLGTICFAEAQAEAEALYYATANRLAQMLDLLHRPTKTEVERQINLRVWWTLYMIDIWCSAGVRLPRQIERPAFAPLPIEEGLFHQLNKTIPPDSDQISQSIHPLETSQSIGLWAQMAKLASIFGEIHDFNEMTVRNSVGKSPTQTTVALLAEKLETWIIDLPSQMHMNPNNLTHYASQGLGQTFAALHLGYHHYNLLLFYQFLALDCHPTVTQASIYADRCKTHAASLCDLLDTCHQTPGCECRYIMIGHMLVVASTVHIHTLLFSSEDHQILQARQRLERNFSTLMRLQYYWPNLDLSLRRLHSFHKACLTSTTTSFRMDRWMLRFLLEHGNVVGDKFLRDTKDINGNSDGDIVVSPADSSTAFSETSNSVGGGGKDYPSWMPTIREWNARVGG